MEGARRQLRGAPVALARLHVATREGAYVAATKAFSFQHQRSGGPLPRRADQATAQGEGEEQDEWDEDQGATVGGLLGGWGGAGAGGAAHGARVGQRAVPGPSGQCAATCWSAAVGAKVLGAGRRHQLRPTRRCCQTPRRATSCLPPLLPASPRAWRSTWAT
jgi:hypothetical protein